MEPLFKSVRQLLSVHRYPAFFMDSVAAKIWLALLRMRGTLRMGPGARLRGLPIVSAVPGATIQVGKGAYLISRSRDTALGVNHPVILRALRENARIQIGDHFRASGATLCAAGTMTIGDRVMMGANVTVVDTDFHSADPEVRFGCADEAGLARTAPVVIADDVFIGMNAMVLKGVTIGRAAIVGAGAVVTSNVPERAVVAGNPARIIQT